MSRSRNLLQGLGLGIALGFLASSASAANMITFSALGDGSVRKGDVVDVSLSYNFTDTSLGGGFDITLNPAAFSFKSFAFDANLGDDPAFRLSPGDGSMSSPLTIAFGNFAGFTGNKRIGTLQLTSNEDLRLGSGDPVLSAADNVTPAGAFQSTTAAPLQVTYNGLLGTAAVVPEPGTLLLLSAGLVGFGVAGRRSR